jgi:hypothetical protein
MGVPTPTGVLQGCAVFSWDGSAWQPSGRAGPSVATPTGVLQGVAPFSWSGSAWTPAGRSQPGVATPTGVLDGVAVYTWSGSAWTPTGGGPTPSTPTGALRGVAAFTWDGAAWQPAAQAGPDVATPFGVLQGVAMFNWSGTAWTPSAGLPAGATLSLNFLTPGALDPLLTFTRASTATYFDATGTMQTAAINAPRWDYDPVTLQSRGLLLEDQRTNLLLNSATPGTQSVAVTAQAYTLSFYGTGTITKSGTATGALVGTGPQRVTQTFTPTAGTLTLTVAGTVSNAQLEAGTWATSWIPTAGATATRSIDSCLITTANMGFFTGSPGGSWFAEFDYANAPAANGVRIVSRADIVTGASTVLVGNTNLVGQYDGVAGANGAAVTSPNVVIKAATTWAAGLAKSCTNGTAVVSTAAATTGYGSFQTAGFRFLSVSAPSSLNNGNGHIRRVSYWPRVLSDAEMQQVTT